MNRVKHFIKAALSLLLAAVMFAGSGISIYAESEPQVVETGVCGDNATWVLYDNGTLKISGTGDAYDYTSSPFINKEFTDIVIENGITYIGNNMFNMEKRYIVRINNILMPESLTNIGKNAFSYCTFSNSLDIPDSVASIGSNAFNHCTLDKGIRLPNGLKTISDGMFYACYLTNIDIPDSVTKIGESAFACCNQLTNIIIPENVDSLNKGSFGDCKNLKSIILGKSVRIINYDAFFGCYSLQNYIVDIDNPYFSSDSVGVLYNKDKSALVKYPLGGPRNYTSSDTVRTISSYAFYNSSIENLDIPYDIKTIGDRAFYSCDFLKSINLSDNVTSIGNEIFSYCSFDTVHFKGTKENWDKIFAIYSAFSKAEIIFFDYLCGEDMYAQFTLNTNTLTISGSGEMTDFASAEDIPWYGIKDSVKKVVFDAQPSSIGDFAFSGFTALEDIDIPDTVLSIGNNAFDGCVSLKNVTISQSVTDIKSATFKNCSSLSSVEIPDSVTAIGDEAFNSCSSLANITLGDSVTSIGEGAFTGTEYYNTASNYLGSNVLYLGDNNRYLIAYGNQIVGQHFNGTVNPGTVLIADGAFRGADCDTVRLGNNIKYIGRQAFADSDIKTVYFPADVISYDNQAFSGCGSITVYYDGPISDWYNMQIALAQGSTVYYTLRSPNGNVEVIYCDADLPQDVGDVTFADKLPSVDVSAKEFDASQTKQQLESISDHTFSFDTYDGFDVMDIALKNKYSFIQPITGRTVTLRIRVPDEVRAKMLDILGYKGNFDEIAITGGEITVNGSDTVFATEKTKLLKKKFVLWHFYNDGMYFGKTYETYTFNSDKLRLENGYFVLQVSHFSEFSFTAVSMRFEKSAQSVVETQSIDLGFINLSEDKVEFVSSKPEIASVDKNGVLTAHKPGTLTVTARQGGVDLDSCEITVVPLKCAIANWADHITVSYKSTVIFRSETENLPDGSSVHWFINGRDEGVGDTFTVKKATDSYTVQLKVLSQEGEVLKESEIETVKVKSGFFDKLIAFFQGIFGTLPTISQ